MIIPKCRCGRNPKYEYQSAFDYLLKSLFGCLDCMIWVKDEEIWCEIMGHDEETCPYKYLSNESVKLCMLFQGNDYLQDKINSLPGDSIIRKITEYFERERDKNDNT